MKESISFVVALAVCYICVEVALGASDLNSNANNANPTKNSNTPHQQPQQPQQQQQSNLKYFSVWQLESANSTADMKGWTNFLFTSSNVKDAIAYHESGLGASLLNVYGVFFDDAHRALYPDAATRWTQTLQTITPLLQSGVLFGVFLGDELCWNCISYANVSWAGTLARRTLPPKSIVYYNEAYPVFTDDKCGDGTAVHYERVPDAFDWISIDYYPDEGTLQGTKDIFNKLVFPKMASHQRALFVPPAYSAPPDKATQLCCNSNTRDGPNPPCNNNCTLAMMQWAVGIYDWARTEPRLIGLNPWYYAILPPPPLPQFPFQPGLAGMPQLLSLYKQIGHEIVSGQLRDLDVQW